jgi:glycosyltransferase involved in cell wall biosynthesis
MRDSKLVSIVTPFYNEKESIEAYFQNLCESIDSLSSFKFEILCIDDGSTDGTLAMLLKISELDPRLIVIEFSRNFGKEAALTAGLELARGDCVVILDADLQDPPSLIGEMLEVWNQGADVVLARRQSRKLDSLPKRVSAKVFYWLHNLISALQMPSNVGDFRLMSRQVVDSVNQLPERQRFMKGLFAWVGFQEAYVEYDRPIRSAGKTKFNGWKLWNFAIDGITSFSTIPLRLWSYLGLLIAILTSIYIIIILTKVLIYGVDVPGYASLLVVTLFLGSLQLIGIGVLGEYIGRIYMEAKQRPHYVIKKITKI